MGLSSNLLWHQTDRESIELILRSQKLLFSYSREQNLWDDSQTAYPMISLCDLPFSEMSDYLGKYGDYTIGFNRTWGLMNHFNPVWYCDQDSFAKRHIQEEVENGNLSIAAYVKPVEDALETQKYIYKNYRYYDEREVRIVPSRKAMEEINEKWSLSSNEYEEYKKQHVDKAIIPKIFIPFSWSDVRFIIVKAENQINHFKKMLADLKCDNTSIGIFSQKRVRQDFIGVAHNIKRVKTPETTDALIKETDDLMKALKESQRELRKLIISAAISGSLF